MRPKALLPRTLAGEQVLEIGEWRVSRNAMIWTGEAAFLLTGLQLPLVFVIVAVEAQQFPVAAIQRVVVVIVITVVNCQLTQIGARERSGAPATYPRVDFQCPLAIRLPPLVGSATRVGHYAI